MLLEVVSLQSFLASIHVLSKLLPINAFTPSYVQTLVDDALTLTA